MATKSFFSVQRIALLGLLTALCYVSRVIFQFLSNVQPVTVILIILVLKMTVVDSWIVAILSTLISNIQLGMGVWTIAQIVSFSILVGITGLLIKPFINQIPFVVMVLFAGLTGYLYGFIISAVQAPFFGIQNFWAYYLAGLPFDTMHALGNAVFYVLLAPVLGSILDRFDVKNRF